MRRGQPIGPDAPAPARRHDDHGDGGAVRGRPVAFAAANLYYAQPLLPLISRDLHAGAGAPRW